ncbi:phosphopantetheine-binding protein [Desulfococcus sp.]|uniref:phosphopantetheine-binding protein n=1 Tax=Desulfococcus sp. TaxID=2025834 RepID=UPI0035944B5C
MAWQLFEDTRMDPEGGWRARVRVEADSPWFSGHFPEDPILPGIAQLAMVLETLRFAFGAVRITGVRRVRFKRVIRPGDSLEIRIQPNPGGVAHAFQIQVGEDIAASGMMTVEPGGPERPQPRKEAHKGDEAEMVVETDKVIRHVAEVMINELKLEDVTPETFDADVDLVDEVGIDSMDLATVALVLQDEYVIRIDEDDYPKLTTVRLIAQYIQNKKHG